jgi:hypothetical protein
MPRAKPVPKKEKKAARLTAEQLERIENLATLQFALDEIAMMMDLEPEELLNDSDADKVWWRGSLRAQEKLRRTLEQQASSGDIAALKLYLTYIETSRK